MTDHLSQSVASYCEFCDSEPCQCSALTRPVPWIEAQLSQREIEPNVYDMEGAPEAVRWEFETTLRPVGAVELEHTPRGRSGQSPPQDLAG